ncbi:hypothetical protein [Sphingomonas sp.]|uniref:hypothetical protein n=1 Tax=Sphingomonas sp. TaxID=28214 RepID=UPI0025EB85DB|nr:hypothetical protein [Sphingomonas sp.]
MLSVDEKAIQADLVGAVFPNNGPQNFSRIENECPPLGLRGILKLPYSTERWTQDRVDKDIFAVAQNID